MMTIFVLFLFFFHCVENENNPTNVLESGLASYLEHILRVNEMFQPKHPFGSLDSHPIGAMDHHRRSFQDTDGTILHPYDSSEQIRRIAQDDPLYQFNTEHLLAEHLAFQDSDVEQYSSKKMQFSKEHYEPFTGAYSKLDYTANLHKGSVNIDAFEELEILKCGPDDDESGKQRDVIIKINKNEDETLEIIKKKWIPGTRFVSTKCPDTNIIYGLVGKRSIDFEDEHSITVRLHSIEIPFSKFFFNSKIEAVNVPGNESKVDELMSYFSQKNEGRRYELDKQVTLQAFNWNYDNALGKRASEKTLWTYDGENGNIVVKCTDCWAYFNANFWIKLETSWGSLVHFEVGMSGQFRSQVELYAEGNYEYLYKMKRNLLDINVCSLKFFIACFPMMIDFDFTIDLYVNIQILGHFIATETVTLSADAKLWYVFDDDTNQNNVYRTFSNNVEYSKPTLDANGTFHAKAWLDSGLHIKPYSLFDITFIPEAWVQFDLAANYEQNTVIMELSRGINIIASVPPIEILGLEFTLGDRLPMEWEFVYQAKTVMPCTFSSCTSPSTMIMKETVNPDHDNVNDNFDNFNDTLAANIGDDNQLPPGSMTGLFGDDFGGGGGENEVNEWKFYNSIQGGKFQAICNCHGDSNCYVYIGTFNRTSREYIWENAAERFMVLWEDEWQVTIDESNLDLHAAISVVSAGKFAVAFLPRIDVFQNDWETLSPEFVIQRGQALVLDTSITKVDFADNIILSVIHTSSSTEFAAFLVRVRIYNDTHQVCQTNGYQPIVVKQQQNEFRIWSTAGEQYPCPQDVNTLDYSMDVTLRAYAGRNPEFVKFRIAVGRANVIGRSYTVNVDQIFPSYGYIFEKFEHAEEYIIEWEDAGAQNDFEYSVITGGFDKYVENYYFDKDGINPSTTPQFFVTSAELGFGNSIGMKYLIVNLPDDMSAEKLEGITALSVIPVENIKSGVGKISTIGVDQNQCFRNPTNVNQVGGFRVDYTHVTVEIRRDVDAFCDLWVDIFTDDGATERETLFKDTLPSQPKWVETFELINLDITDVFVYAEHIAGVDTCEYQIRVFQAFHIFEWKTWSNIRIGASEWVYVLSTDTTLQDIKFEFSGWDQSYRLGAYVHHSDDDAEPIYIQDIGFGDLLMILDARPFYQDIGHTSGQQYLGLYNPNDEDIELQVQLNHLPACSIELIFEGTEVTDVRVDIVKAKYEGLPFTFDITKCDNAHFFNKEVVSREILDSTLESLPLHNKTGKWMEYVWWNNFVKCFRDVVNPLLTIGDYESIYEYVNIADDPNVLRLKVPPCESIEIEKPGQEIEVFLDIINPLGKHKSGGGNTYKILAAEDDRTMMTGQTELVFYAPMCDLELWDVECRVPKCFGSVDGCGDHGGCNMQNLCVCEEGYYASSGCGSSPASRFSRLGLEIGIGGVVVVCFFMGLGVGLMVVVGVWMRKKKRKMENAGGAAVQLKDRLLQENENGVVEKSEDVSGVESIEII